MTCWPVGARVGNVKNNDPSLIERSAAQWTCVDGSPRCSSVWRSSAASRYQPVRDNSRTLPMHRRRCRTGAAICSEHSPRSKMMSPDHGKRKLRLIRHNFCVFAYPLSLALATLSAVSPVASVTSGAAIAFLPETALPSRSARSTTPRARSCSRHSVRRQTPSAFAHVSFFGPNGSMSRDQRSNFAWNATAPF